MRRKATTGAGIGGNPKARVKTEGAMVGARSQTRSWHPEAANSPGNRPNNSEGQFPVWWLPRSTRPLSSSKNVCTSIVSAQLGLGRQDVVTRLQLTSHRGPQRASNGGLTGSRSCASRSCAFGSVSPSTIV
eukprot:gene25652-11315_t